MKRITSHFNVIRPAPRAIAATALLAAIASAGLAHAAPSDSMLVPVSGVSAVMLADATSPKRKMSSPANMEKDTTESVDAHIKALHDKFQITASQEDKWAKVAQVMRENADKLTALMKARSENAEKMTAVDDLKSYAEITEAHQSGIDKLLPVFTDLYNSMSDTQKQSADAEFHHQHHRHSHSPS